MCEHAVMLIELGVVDYGLFRRIQHAACFAM